MLSRLLDRQTSRGCHHVQTMILRLLCLECHGGLRCCRPGARRPPSAGLRQQRRNRSMLNLACADCNHETPDPGNTQESGTAKIKKGKHPSSRDRQRRESFVWTELESDFAHDRHCLRCVHSGLQPRVVQNSQKQLVLVGQESEFLVVVEDGRPRIQAVIE